MDAFQTAITAALLRDTDAITATANATTTMKFKHITSINNITTKMLMEIKQADPLKIDIYQIVPVDKNGFPKYGKTRESYISLREIFQGYEVGAFSGTRSQTQNKIKKKLQNDADNGLGAGVGYPSGAALATNNTDSITGTNAMLSELDLGEDEAKAGDGEGYAASAASPAMLSELDLGEDEAKAGAGEGYSATAAIELGEEEAAAKKR